MVFWNTKKMWKKYDDVDNMVKKLYNINFCVT